MQATESIMDRPLLISSILNHAELQYGDVCIASRETNGSLFRYTYADAAPRARRLANALARLGLGEGDVVGSIAWNNHRHLEAYFAVSGSGMVMHTCNPRLQIEQLAYIINHANDRAVLFDVTFAGQVEQLAERCPRVEAWICLCEPRWMPDLQRVDRVFCYESLLAAEAGDFEWPDFDERKPAALCYTSGTTGNPKGVLYSHRKIVLNSLVLGLPGSMDLSAYDVVLPAVPMFHINAWCIPYAAPINGSKLVLPGPNLDGASLYELMESEGVTVSAGVPTIWHGLAQYMEAECKRFSTFRRAVVGGAAMAPSLIARYVEHFGVEVRCGWGMTETTAVATMSGLLPSQADLCSAEKHALRSRPGRSLFGVEVRIVDGSGQTLPRDGVSVGELHVRGLWVLSSYFKSETSPLRDGWFPTGDVAKIDPDGMVQITDRVKDVIKSGGEWISSIDLEHAAMEHPSVALASVIGVSHPKWDERPMMFVVRKPGQPLDRDGLLAFLSPRVARWWLPDDVVFLDELPLNGTGKVDKLSLRRRYAGISA
ncbi:long-chain-fatty-acid--CoA ligase [Burkholderia sp. Bp9140]|uniref:long-chain-fatty-acid--CoA ligase n=1 Tax=Burkholderia sp. Bp9140 TaxID=2184572 RepID=UPI0021AB66E7|nr:long-chain-fatty-acid--CoA ligase [Burkholderia sp. Bp9140]